jgi:hypothetical protein
MIAVTGSIGGAGVIERMGWVIVIAAPLVAFGCVMNGNVDPVVSELCCNTLESQDQRKKNVDRSNMGQRNV